MKTFSVPLLPLFLFVAFCVAGILSAAGTPDGDLFLVVDPSKVDTSLGFDPADEKLYASTRDTVTEDEIQNQKNAKAGLFNTVFDELRNERYESVLLDIKKYVECVRQIYGPAEPAYRDVVAESLSLFARALAGKEDYLNAIRCWQLILDKYKDTAVAPKAALDWAKVFVQVYDGRIKEKKGVAKPAAATLLKRILYVKTIKPDDEAVADAYLMAADLMISERNGAEAKKYLALIEKEFPRSQAADGVAERRAKTN